MATRRVAIRFFICCAISAFSTFAVCEVAHSAETSPADTTLAVVVMDPLAKVLSCPCVQGYAQRDYSRLAKYLESRLGRPVKLIFAESLAKGTKETNGRADLVIGKHSVVLFDANRLQRKLLPVAALSGKDGLTTQSGLIVVRTEDPAQSVADLKSHRLIFGPAECDEKNAAAVALFKSRGVALPTELETVAGCEEGAVAILEMPAGTYGAAVISSYAKPLLEGCGTVPKGAIRVVGETQPVPFVEAFVAADVDADLKNQLTTALLQAVSSAPELLIALETQRGFVDVGSGPQETRSTADAANVGSKKK